MNLTVGTKITVMHRGAPMQATIRSVVDDEANGTAFGYEPASPHVDSITEPDPNGIIFPEDEGVEWLLGWGEDAGAVLLATQALRPEPGMFFGTSTGRWQSQRPNIQNYPKRASGKP